MQTQANTLGDGAAVPSPHGGNSICFESPPFFGITQNTHLASYFVDSFDFISGVPDPASHTAMGLGVVSLASGSRTPLLHITVFDRNNVELGDFEIETEGVSIGFVGILATGGDRIGRVNIFDLYGGAQGISTMALYTNCPWDLSGDGVAGVADLLLLLSAWGPNRNHPADFDDDGTVGVADLLALLASWGPCP